MHQPMPAITSIGIFLAHVRNCTDTPAAQTLERRITAWLAYYHSLQFIRERYHQTNTAYIQAITHYLQMRERLPRDLRLSPTAAQHAWEEAHALHRALQEKQASFYTFAAGLLNSIADTFQCYFALAWPRSDITHARLTRDFYALCLEHRLLPAPTALPTLMRELHAYIVAAPASRAPVIDERPEERLMALSTAMDVYIAAMMQFFTRNVEHSVLGRGLADHRQAIGSSHPPAHPSPSTQHPP
jgi:hypothetical protein